MQQEEVDALNTSASTWSSESDKDTTVTCLYCQKRLAATSASVNDGVELGKRCSQCTRYWFCDTACLKLSRHTRKTCAKGLMSDKWNLLRNATVLSVPGIEESIAAAKATWQSTYLAGCELHELIQHVLDQDERQQEYMEPIPLANYAQIFVEKCNIATM